MMTEERVNELVGHAVGIAELLTRNLQENSLHFIEKQSIDSTEYIFMIIYMMAIFREHISMAISEFCERHQMRKMTRDDIYGWIDSISAEWVEKITDKKEPPDNND